MANWSRTHSLAAGRIAEMCRERAAPFERERRVGEADDERDARRELPLLPWCRTYLPHYFDRPFAPFHRRMADAVGGPGMPTFVAAFRGAGKSALLSLARPLRRILRGEAPYVLFGSQVQKLAARTMDFIRLELDHNERIRGDYGPVDTDGAQDGWVARLAADDTRPGPHAQCRLEAFGIGQSPRGRRFRQFRPAEFVGDDLETAELARNPDREQQLWDWLMDEILPALEPREFAFTVVGTMFGPHCMMERARELASRRDARGRALAQLFVQPALDPRGASVWPERFPDRVLARVRQTIGLRNWLRNFALVAEDPTRPFQPDWLRSYDPHEVDRGRLDVVCFLDPALSQSTRGCPRALVAVGADRADGARYVLDAWIERGSPMEMLDRLVAFHRRWRPRLIGVEQNGGYALLRPLLEMRTGGAFMPVRYVSHHEAKEVRIERLAPAMEAGLWRFPRNPSRGVRTLQEQILNYPQGFVDGPDALAGCEELLPDAGHAGGAYRSLSRRRDLAAL